MNKKGYKSFVLTTILVFILIFNLNSNSYSLKSNNYKVIRIETEVLNLRVEPWGSKIGVVRQGNFYYVRSHRKDANGNVWYRIKSGSKYGYIYAGGGYTKVTRSGNANQNNSIDPPKDVIRIEAAALNLRTEPWGDKIGLVKQGTEYIVYSSREDANGNVWYRIKSNSRYGYIYAGNGYTRVIKKETSENNKPSLKPTSTDSKKIIIRIETEALNFRVKPWGQKIGLVKQGSKYRVYSSKQDFNGNTWYRIRSANRYGYIYAGNGYTKIIEKNTKTSVNSNENGSRRVIRIKSKMLNIRTKPWGSKIGVVRKGNAYYIRGSKKDLNGTVWYKIKSGNKYGYIYAGHGYVSFVNSPNNYSSSGAYTPRLTPPDGDSKFYTWDNVFHVNGYGMPNCTCYAWGRAYEILGSKPTWLSKWNANTFYDENHENFPFGRGEEIKVGSIACWGSNRYSSLGHVAVVEKIDSYGRITISESSSHGKYFQTKTFESTEELEDEMGGNFQGYIYLGVFDD